MIQLTELRRPLLIGASVVALAACSSTPEPNPRISTLQYTLEQAYADPYISDRAAQQLRMADTSIGQAQQSWMDSDEERAFHEMEMAEGYLEIARLKGEQARAKDDIQTLKAQQAEVRLQARERKIAKAEWKAQQSEARADQLESQLSQVRNELSEYEIKARELGATLVLRDVMFELDSAQLRAGAVNRLNPLIEYLQLNKKVNIRIEGHTDSTGADSYNRDLSQKRAESVARELVAAGIPRERIETIGMGETRPIASNETVSGREENRRVEITLIQS